MSDFLPSLSNEDAARYPTLSAHGAAMLQRLRAHPAAPLYRNHSGNRLTVDDLAATQAYAAAQLERRVDWRIDQPPLARWDWVARQYQHVPYYRRMGAAPTSWHAIPTVRRADLSADIAAFVPDDIALDRLINYRTTGTTGTPLLIPSHPQVAARTLIFHRRALRRFGIEPRASQGDVGVVLIGFQRHCFTYVSVTPAMQESGLAKVNLHPDDWRDPADRARYLDAMQPELIAGDPISFAELLRLPLQWRPRALLSVAMALSSGLRQALEARYDCPVLDLYSLNEVGPVAVYDPSADAHVLLQPDLYVEILRPDDTPCPAGEVGEIVLSGGFNFCLPLLRYRTGDYASLRDGIDAPCLHQLSGRQPVRFLSHAGVWLNNIDISHALAPLALAQYQLHQAADSALCLRLRADEQHQGAACARALAELLGPLPLHIEPLHADDKVLQYRSDLPGAMVESAD